MGSRKLTIEYLPVASLRPDPKNARVHGERQVQQIAKSIKAFGFNVPILIDANSQVIAGHGRLLACTRLGIAGVPVIRLEHVSEHQRRAFMIADNKLTENAKWDRQLLGEQLKVLSDAELDFSLEVTAFEMGEIDLMIENLSPAVESAKDPADAIPEASSLPVSRIGDLWQLGKHRILCGDALSEGSYEALLGDRRANVVFTDPPYNVPIAGNMSGKGRNQHREFLMVPGEMNDAEFTKFLSNAFARLATYTLSGSLHYICMDWRHMKELLAAGDAAYSELKNVCAWVKDNAGMGSLYRSQHELVFVFKNGTSSHRNNVQLGRCGRSRSNVWNYPSANSFVRTTYEGNLLELHPTVKPIALVADAIKDCTARGGVVLDPFMGSGTSIVAAERTGRVCYGMDLDPLYMDTAIRRWQRFTNLEAIHQATRKTFDQCEQEVAHGSE